MVISRMRKLLARVAFAGLCASFLWLQAGQAAPAGIAKAPANAPMAFSIPNTPEWWAKAHQLPLVQAFESYIKSPEVSGDVNYQQFQLELNKIESALGYPLTLGEIFGNVFSSLLVTAQPAAAAGTKPSAVATLGVKDEAKVKKLLTLIEQKNPTLMEFLMSGAREANPASTATVEVEKLNVAGAEVLHLHQSTAMAEAEGLLIAHPKGRLIASNARLALEQALADVSAAQSLADNADYQRLNGKVDVNEADAQLWIDGNALAATPGVSKALMAVPGLGQATKGSNKVLVALKMVPGGIEGHSASTADPTRQTPNIKVQPLKALDILPGQPLMGVDYGLLDAKQLYEMSAPMMAMMGGTQGNSPIQKFEQMSGISLQNDLIPALGQEMVFTVNNFQANPIPPYIPVIDLVIGLQVKDEAKMKVVLGKLETWLAGMAPPPITTATPAPDGSTPPPATAAFKTSKTPHGEVRTLDTGIPGLSPSYAMQQGFVIIGLGEPSITSTLARLATKANDTSAFKTLSNADGVYSSSTIDLPGIIAKIVVPYMPIVMSQAPNMNLQKTMQFINQVVVHAGTMSAAGRIEDGLEVTRMKIEMK